MQLWMLWWCFRHPQDNGKENQQFVDSECLSAWRDHNLAKGSAIALGLAALVLLDFPGIVLVNTRPPNCHMALAWHLSMTWCPLVILGLTLVPISPSEPIRIFSTPLHITLLYLINYEGLAGPVGKAGITTVLMKAPLVLLLETSPLHAWCSGLCTAVSQGCGWWYRRTCRVSARIQLLLHSAVVWASCCLQWKITSLAAGIKLLLLFSHGWHSITFDETGWLWSSGH